LGESVNLIVVTAGQREQLGNEFFEPWSSLGKTNRTAGEKVGLGNQS
jgi:hypothetical protein